MINEAIFITFEGGEGSGKTTQIKLFVEWFKDFYGPCVVSREPGGVKEAEEIRKVLLDKKNVLTPESELILFETARKFFVKDKIASTLIEGKSFISDRFYDSTSVYQGRVGGLSKDLVDEKNMEAVYVGGKYYTPDLTFLLDIDPKIGLERVRNGGNWSRFEAKGLEYHEKVRKGYLEVAKENPERIRIINVNKDIKSIQNELREEFSKKYL
jgi:dTMP kinase